MTHSPLVAPLPAHAPLAFIGLGVMGGSMAGHLLAAGHPLTVYTRSAARAAPLVAAGARLADSAAEAVRGAAATISIVGFPQDVRQVYLGPEGVVAAAEPGSLLIDMTTSSPSLAREIAAAAAARGIAALDAPVSGGDIGARNASLSIMVGGEAEAFARARPLLERMGRTLVYQGPAGAGQHCKLCNQIAIAGTMLGAMEALVYARGVGLEPLTVLESIGAGAAASWTLSNLYPRAVRGDLGPGFYAEHFLKDLRLALEEASSRGLRLPGLSLAERLYERLVAEGGGRLGTQALIQVLSSLPVTEAADEP